ncbi:MAG: cell division protein FtsA, partial [Crocinitomicaceae bacterium]|nr:cell division protein FtsA [Crocinitomicaceae bacterium]
MEEKKRIVGLDIGTTKIVCFVGEKNEHGKIDILSMGKSESLGVVKGVVQNIQRTIESISTAVSRAQEKMEDDFIISDVYVG